MPNNSAIGSGPRGSCTMLWRVPIDDTHHWRFEFFSHPTQPMDRTASERTIDAERADGYTARRKPANRWLQDRSEDVAAGRDPAGVARTAKQNDWRDLVALTEEMDENGDASELCGRMEERGIHITEADAPIEAGGMKLA